MPEPTHARAILNSILSLLLLVLGVVMVIRTVDAGGGPLSTGVILGLLFVAGGAGRLYIGRARR